MTNAAAIRSQHAAFLTEASGWLLSAPHDVLSPETLARAQACIAAAHELRMGHPAAFDVASLNARVTPPPMYPAVYPPQCHPRIIAAVRKQLGALRAEGGTYTWGAAQAAAWRDIAPHVPDSPHKTNLHLSIENGDSACADNADRLLLWLDGYAAALGPEQEPE